MLDQLGIVFHHNMGHTLSHFDVHLAGPMGRLLVHGSPCYELSILRGHRDEQDLATIRHFQDFAIAACDAAHTKFSDAGRAALQSLAGQPALLMLDYCNPKIAADQKVAIGQLGAHLAAAYFDYCEDGQPNTAPHGGPTDPLANSGVNGGPPSVS
jgi:hypothetical protein